MGGFVDPKRLEELLDRAEEFLYENGQDRECEAIEQLRVLRKQAAAYLREVGDDYPGSSCHTWCHQMADKIFKDIP